MVNRQSLQFNVHRVFRTYLHVKFIRREDEQLIILTFKKCLAPRPSFLLPSSALRMDLRAYLLKYSHFTLNFPIPIRCSVNYLVACQLPFHYNGNQPRPRRTRRRCRCIFDFFTANLFSFLFPPNTAQRTRSRVLQTSGGVRLSSSINSSSSSSVQIQALAMVQAD